MVTGIVYSDRYLDHKTGSHVESPERLVAIMELVRKDGLLDEYNGKFKLIPPRSATIDEIRMIHDDSMIQKAKIMAGQATDGRLKVLDFGDTVVSEDSYEVSLLAAGGLLVAADAVLGGEIQNAFCLVRPPGHHANRTRSSGFCVFNNMAILTEYLIQKKGLKKVAIFDIDLHHGNGTQELFYGRDDVLFFSSHQDGRTQYPGSGFPNEIGEGPGKGFNINVPLVPGASNDVTEKTFNEILKPIFEQFNPDIILGSIGGDAHFSDPLSGLEFTTQGYAGYVDGFKQIAEKCCNGKMILTLEGGYRVNILAKIVVNILHVLAGEEPTYKDREVSSGKDVLEYHDDLIVKLKEIFSKYWKL